HFSLLKSPQLSFSKSTRTPWRISSKMCSSVPRSLFFTKAIDLNDPFVSEVVLKRSRKTNINIVFDSEKIFLYEIQPKYNIIEVMSNIGGFLGMWMGVSMIAVMNLFENIVTMFYYCIKKRRSKKKTTVIRIA
ncbi:hypothetical protein TNCT_632261, partial [Trichonephila clavata]